ncbi:hypothetical protein T4E_7782 [Trichinella pseudospiralis]|uniref:Uncharacterized protein n=1 Tax=Trichinella pseudospiralis TaxID=6337 RepID=A0A0V0Y9H6_TRIPS|nr:hypothetical protein T4E_7782 [Trichinella pseudospiralis]
MFNVLAAARILQTTFMAFIEESLAGDKQINKEGRPEKLDHSAYTLPEAVKLFDLRKQAINNSHSAYG